MAYRLLDEENSEGIGESVLRSTGRIGSKLLTRAAGLPGDILNLATEYVGRPIAKSLGAEDVPYNQTLLSKVLPQTESLRSGFSKEFIEPKNKIESFLDDVIEDTALMFVPGGKASKISVGAKAVNPSMKITKNLAKSLGANLAGEAVSETTGSEKAGQWTKSGMLFFSSLLDTPKVAGEVNKLYQQASKNLPQGATSSATRLERNVQDLERRITRGRPRGNLSEPEEWVLKQSDKVKNLISNGVADVDQIWAQKISLNQELGKRVYEAASKSEKKSLRRQATQINGYLNEDRKSVV